MCTHRNMCKRMIAGRQKYVYAYIYVYVCNSDICVPVYTLIGRRGYPAKEPYVSCKRALRFL